jgi:hypothetical protein
MNGELSVKKTWVVLKTVTLIVYFGVFLDT